MTSESYFRHRNVTPFDFSIEIVSAFKFCYSLCVAANLRVGANYRPQKHVVLVVMFDVTTLVAIYVESLIHILRKVNNLLAHRRYECAFAVCRTFFSWLSGIIIAGMP